MKGEGVAFGTTRVLGGGFWGTCRCVCRSYAATDQLLPDRDVGRRLEAVRLAAVQGVAILVASGD